MNIFHARMLGAPYDAVKHNQRLLVHSQSMSLKDRINELFDDYVREKDPAFCRADFARAVKVSRATVTDWMNGTTQTINGEKAHEVAKFFNVNAEYVQTGKGKKYPDRKMSEAEKAIEKVVAFATDSIDKRMPDMSRDDRIKAISLCLMHYSLNTAIPDDELQKMIDKVLPCS